MALFASSNSLGQSAAADLGRCGLPFNCKVSALSASEAVVSAGNRLLAAAAMGEVEQALRCLADGADFNFRDPSSGETAHHRAAQRNQVLVLELLSAAGADSNLRDRCQRTPLFVAANAGHIPAVIKLLSHGALLFPDQPRCTSSNSNGTRDSGTCLGCSSSAPAPLPPPHEVDDESFLALRSTCPLAAAAAAARWPIVAALLGALPRDYQRRPAALRSLRFLVWALASHKAFPHEVIARLPQRLPACVIDAVRPAYLASTPLVLATGNDQQQLMQWLLQQGANPELGAPLLLCAGRFCHGSRTCCVSTLLRRGARPDVAWADDPSDSPLRLAARGDCFSHVHCLVAYGADVGGEAARVQEALYSPAPWEAHLDALLQQYGKVVSACGTDPVCPCGHQHSQWPGLWPLDLEEEEEEGGEVTEGAGGNSCTNRMPADDAWHRHNRAQMEQLQDGNELAECRKAVEDLWRYGSSAVVSELGGSPSAPHSLMPQRILAAMQDVAGGWLAAALRCRQQRRLRADLYDKAVKAGHVLLDRKRVAALAALSGGVPTSGGGGGGAAALPLSASGHCGGTVWQQQRQLREVGEAQEGWAARAAPAAPAAALLAELRMEILALAGLAPPGVKAQMLSGLSRPACGCVGCSN